MMQDHSRNVSDSAKVMYTLYPQWIYAPCKNSLTEAKRKYDAGLPPQCAATAELEIYESGLWRGASLCAVVESEGNVDDLQRTVDH
jgi:hypothetical protein